MKTNTYALNPGRDSGYYELISGYHNELITEAEEVLIPVVKGLILYLHTNPSEDVRSRQEYLSDFLLIGDLWNEFILNKYSFSSFEYRKFLFLYRLNRKSFIKKTSLWKILSAGFPGKKVSLSKLLKKIDLNDFKELLIRAQSSGRFTEEIRRLELIYSYLAILPDDYINHILNNIISFSLWLTFEERRFTINNEVLKQAEPQKNRNKKADQNILTEVVQVS